MESGFLDIVILAFLAGFILLRLRSVLGTREGAERPHEDAPRANGQLGDSAVDAVEGDVIDMNTREPHVAADLPMDDAARPGLTDIAQADAGFNGHDFLEGARSAYAMILEAFWGGDKDTLKTFVADDVYDQFAAAVDERDTAGHVMEARVVETRELKISDARLFGTLAEVTVRFVSDIVSVTRDSAGTVIDGTLSDAVEVIDLWTFRRDTASRDPNWVLVATRAG